MELNSNLLNEVIADAKAVRETAVQTAISRLKETFEPTVRSLISQKLAEEEGYEEEDEMDDMEAPAPEMEAPAPKTDMAAPAPEPEMEDDITDDELEEILAELEGEAEEEPMATESEDEMEKAIDELYEEEMGSEDSDDEITTEALDELIAEMEDELKESWVHNWGQKEYDPADDFESIYESRKNRNKSTSSSLVQENRKLKRQLVEAQSQLKTAFKAITTQKNAINEVNLLNSKLLFLTKITSKHKLTPQKQVKVLEAFDRAQTIREVKLVYATISESLDRAENSKLNGIVESASKPIRSVNKSLNENTFVSRWQELAGIKK